MRIFVTFLNHLSVKKLALLQTLNQEKYLTVLSA